METGLYVTFLDPTEPRDRQLPPVGPLDHVVLRDRQLLAERVSVWQAPDMSVAIDRLLEAELELQRATGEEPGGHKRPQMRFASRDGVFLRFVTFGDSPEPDALPELGPFAVVVVGPRSVDADGREIALRTAGEPARWELSPPAGQTIAGAQKPDIAFRTATGAYHGALAGTSAAPTPPRAEPVFTPPPRDEPAFQPPPRAETALTPPPFVELPPREPMSPPPHVELAATPPPRVEPKFTPPVTSEPLFKPSTEKGAPRSSAPPPTEPPALAASNRELTERIERERTEETLRARIQGKERERQAPEEPRADTAAAWRSHYRPQAANRADDDVAVGADDGAGGLGGLLWRLRFVIIGVLVVGAGIYGFTVFQEASTPSVGAQFSFVNVGARFTGTRWEWTINGTQRVPESGKLKAQGVFYLVRVGTTNLGTEGAQLTPGDFSLIDANGIEHAALGLTSGAYQGPNNSGSPNIWPPTFPVGKSVTFNLLFDIEPTLGRGMVLVIGDAPRTRVHLD